MEIEYQASPQDYSQFIKSYYFKKDIGKRLLLLVILSLWIGSFKANGQSFVLSVFTLKVLIAAASLLIVFGLIPFLNTTHKLKKTLKTKTSTEVQSILVNSDGIIITTGNEIASWRWEALDKADIVKNYLFFTLFTNKLYIIPLRSFSSYNEAINFLGLLRNGVTRVKGENRNRKIRDLYYWGLVGFVPNFGVIAGIILLIKGFQYNQIKLMLVGVADILFTFFFWTVMFPHMIAK